MADKQTPCYICKIPATADVPGDAEIVSCPRCGRYRISGTMIRLLETSPLTEVQIANASSWLRRSGDSILTSHDLDWLRRIPTPTVDEQGTRLLRELARQHPIPGRFINVPVNDPSLYGLAGAVDLAHMDFLVRDYLAHEKRFLALGNDFPSNSAYAARISPAGWSFVAIAAEPNSESPYGFVAMNFDSSMLDLRRQGLVAGIEAAGYDALLVDEKDFDNDVVDEILTDIRRSRFVVADFTGHRRGVYFEAGFAQGLGIPVIRTCLDDECKDLHFDVNHYPFILWQRGEYAGLRARLQQRIEALIGRGPKAPKNS